MAFPFVKRSTLEEMERSKNYWKDQTKQAEIARDRLEDDVLALKKENADLRTQLEKAQKNDQPKDKKTGKFTKKAATKKGSK